MKNKFKTIENALDVDSTEISKDLLDNNIKITKNKDNKEENCQEDYEYVRGNLYSLIEKGQEAIVDIMELARQSDSPRAFEVAAQLLKNVADVSDKLIDLHQKKKKIEEEDPKGPKNVTNALFVGSTSDLQKLLKNSFNNSK